MTPQRRIVPLIALVAVLVIGAWAGAAPPQGATPEERLARLPRYDLDMQLDLDGHVVHVRQRVTWTNHCARPAAELVFNAHSHFKIPEGKGGFLAKMVEILRLSPTEALDGIGEACQIDKVFLDDGTGAPKPLDFSFQPDNLTALVVPLPHPVGHEETVTVEIQFTMRLPQKQGRWGQWGGVTFLSNWQPVLAFYDETGWQPTQFIPWHQPFFNESGNFHVTATLPCGQRIACTGSVHSVTQLPDGLQRVEIVAPGVRDFAFLCCPCYEDYSGMAGPVKVHVMAFPEHEYMARVILKAVSEALVTYSKWLGPYPYPEFTIAESYFGWNGNECAGLVMIDERVFDMPHLSTGYVDYLVSHETCHQWWYNVIGTNGYCETWMDEGLATYFAHRITNCKYGHNNNLLQYPKGLEWMPNIARENYRHYGFYGTLGRGENGPVVQEMPKFGHLVNLFSMCYDKGAKIVGMIEDHMGSEEAFLDFMHVVYTRYQFGILRVKDFQAELEAYTGRSWEAFFDQWLYKGQLSDWSIEDVQLHAVNGHGSITDHAPLCWFTHAKKNAGPYRVKVLLQQKAEINEQTVLGFCLDDGPGFQVRVPILPQVPVLDLDNPPAHIQWLDENRVEVTVTLPSRPTQIMVDPDHILVDRNPYNNTWKPGIRLRVTPLYTMLDETDLTNDYDKWNVLMGPWLYASAYNDAWYARSPMAGARIGLYRTQQFVGGLYTGYRTDYQDVVVGADALWEHTPWPHTEFGFNVEQRLFTVWNGDQSANRASVFGRYVIDYGSSLYLPPMQFLEAFGQTEDNFLPLPRYAEHGERFDRLSTAGVHYHLDYLTPYWDPEGGFAVDATYQGGSAKLCNTQGYNALALDLRGVKSLPDGLGWFSDTRIAGRIFGAGGLPDRGEYFALGGSDRFRGFDLSQRQGNAIWSASLEWRVPVIKQLNCDICDHTVGVRGVYAAAFYDVGDAMVSGHSLGPVAHAVGGGVYLDLAFFSFVERGILRFDMAKTVNVNSPWQFWLGFTHPF